MPYWCKEIHKEWQISLRYLSREVFRSQSLDAGGRTLFSKHSNVMSSEAACVAKNASTITMKYKQRLFPGLNC